MKYLILTLLFLCSVQARELYPGQYANVPQEIREWFTAQLVPGGPGKGMSCCTTADGVDAEEDIRGDQYWTRFNTQMGRTDWMPVPHDAVLKEPNKRGAAVVWYYFENAVAKIRCFAPGAKT